jgi:hypothetical protein
LEFTGPIFAEMTRGDFEKHKHAKEWLVEFPEQSLRVL